jgi:hypothetical protein
MALGPLAYWRLDDVGNGTTMTDVSGNAHHGTWNAVTSHTVTSGLLANEPDNALLMTGTGGEGAVVPSASWMNITTNMSWVILFKTTDTAAHMIDRAQVVGGGQDWSLQIGSQFYFLAGGSTVAASTATGLNDNTMHLAVVTYNGSSVKLYVDGALDKSVAYSAPLPTSAYDITVGYGGGLTSAAMFTGTLDEAILYASVLSATDVADLWAAAT